MHHRTIGRVPPSPGPQSDDTNQPSLRVFEVVSTREWPVLHPDDVESLILRFFAAPTFVPIVQKDIFPCRSQICGLAHFSCALRAI